MTECMTLLVFQSQPQTKTKVSNTKGNNGHRARTILGELFCCRCFLVYPTLLTLKSINRVGRPSGTFDWNRGT